MVRKVCYKHNSPWFRCILSTREGHEGHKRTSTDRFSAIRTRWWPKRRWKVFPCTFPFVLPCFFRSPVSLHFPFFSFEQDTRLLQTQVQKSEQMTAFSVGFKTPLVFPSTLVNITSFWLNLVTYACYSKFERYFLLRVFSFSVYPCFLGGNGAKPSGWWSKVKRKRKENAYVFTNSSKLET